MKTPPPGLDVADLQGALRTCWSMDVSTLTYAAVGFGSHHWTVETTGGDRWFVTVDDLAKVRLGDSADVAFADLERAFTTAQRLHDDGFEAMVAPAPSADGRSVERLGDGFSVAVFPWVEAPPPAWGAHRSDDVDDLRAVLADLHARTPAVEGAAGREDFELPCRASLEAALADIAGRWDGGPFSEQVRAGLAAQAPFVETALTHYDSLVRQVLESGDAFVVTHGEPHAGNVLWTATGPKLIDWDTVLIAPPERDLWMLMTHDDARRDERAGIALYALWWDLSEIGQYVTELRAPHAYTDDTREAFDNFGDYIDVESNWAHVRAITSR